MEEELYKGKISFINYEKQFATIEYLQNNKSKSVNCKTTEAGSGKKPHQYRLGDGVSFQLKLSDRGDKMTAYNVKFTHNETISLLVQKAAIENRFSGYLKIVDGRFFVKEIDSYILFPIQLSKWEREPVETAANEAIAFKLLNVEKPNSIVAELFSHNYFPEYKKALQHFNNKIEIEAIVYKLSPHAVYLNLFGDKMQAKLSITGPEIDTVKEGDTIQVVITHLTPNRIVVKRL
ncbi:MAG: hypothetical protein SGI96_17265 [Bacteroidota bacterium]|nr:hypothetical protein [Bacteroidota bacterium]